MSKELCGRTVYWWDGEYDGVCELPEGHAGPHYDGMSCFNDESEEVELKLPPIPPVHISIGYYRAGQLYQVHNQLLNNDNQIVTMQPEPGAEIRVEISK